MSSWWTTAPREGFTAQWETAPKVKGKDVVYFWPSSHNVVPEKSKKPKSYADDGHDV